MKKNRIEKAAKIVAFGILGLGVFGFVVMSLWNWLMPAIFGLRLISFWQALGLVLLGKILFGGFRGHAGGGRQWRRMCNRWNQMTPEDREKFRQCIENFCAPKDGENGGLSSEGRHAYGSASF